MLAATVILAAGMVFAQLSPVFALKRVELTGPLCENARVLMDDMVKEHPHILSLNQGNLVRKLLAQNGIDNVSLDWMVPDGLTAKVNCFAPAALVLTGDGTIKALDKFGRLIPFDHEWADFDCPVLSGLPEGKLFEPLADYRLAEVIAVLNVIRDQNPGLYAMLAEFNFSDPVFIKLRTTVSHSVFLVRSHCLANQLRRLEVVCRQEKWENRYVYDLTYKGKVIRK